MFCSKVPVLQLWFPNALHYCLISTYLLPYLYCWWTAQRFHFMCQVSTDGWEEEAGGSHCSARRRAGRGARQHGAAERPLQKDHYAGVMEGINNEMPSTRSSPTAFLTISSYLTLRWTLWPQIWVPSAAQHKRVKMLANNWSAKTRSWEPNWVSWRALWRAGSRLPSLLWKPR